MNTTIDSTNLLLLLAVLLAGTLIGWTLSRLRMEAALERARGEEATARAGLEERLKSRDESLLLARETNTGLEQELDIIRQEHTELHSQISQLSEKLRSADEEQALLQKVQEQFTNAFRALSSEALKSNNQSFLELAQSTLSRFQEGAKGDLEKRATAIDQLVKPVKESLEKFELKIHEIEKARVGAYEGLSQQVRSLVESQTQLRSETTNLVKALGTPRIRGRWGEIQLRRVVEMAGMLDHCDFSEQQSANTEEGRIRPDLIVHLPAGKSIVVDSKAPMAGYLEAIEAPDEETRKARLIDHARHLRDHAQQLGRKAYWEQFNPTPEFVILFVPGEAFFSAALEQAPELIEQAVAERVLFATPMTLIALLKAVAYGWRQERLAQNAADISLLGKTLYKRLGDLSQNFDALGAGLGKAVESYNKAVSNLESKVLSTARKFKDLDSTGVEKEITVLDQIDHQTREIQSGELRGL